MLNSWGSLSIKRISSYGTINPLRSKIISTILKRAYATEQKITKVMQAELPEFEHQQSHTRAKFVTMFDEISAGADFKSSCVRLGIEAVDGALALNKLQVLQAIKTQKGVQAIINPDNKNQISLRPPRGRKEQLETTKLLTHLNKFFDQSPDDIINMCVQILCKSNTSDSGIKFDHPDDLHKFTQYFSCFPKSRWYTKIEASNPKNAQSWQKLCKGMNISFNNKFTQDARNPRGKTTIYLQRADINQGQKIKNQWKKHSTNIPKYCAFLFLLSEPGINATQLDIAVSMYQFD